MSLSLTGQEIYQFDEVISELTNFWKGTIRSLPHELELTPAFLAVQPALKAIYRWSVSLTAPRYPATSPDFEFCFSKESWDELIQLFTQVSNLFLEISPLLPNYPSTIKTCFQAAKDYLLAAYDLLECWSDRLNLGSLG